MSPSRWNTAMRRTALASILTVALSANTAFGWACIEIGNGNTQCISWTQHAATLRSFLGGSWDADAFAAAGDWNAVGADFQFGTEAGGTFYEPCPPGGTSHACSDTGPANDNPIIFRPNVCGIGFGDIIAQTNDCYDAGSGAIYNAPVFVNNTQQWSTYDGALQVGGNGQVVYDIRRVLLHEFGHVLGLDHPDAHGQTVVAIMNSGVSNLYTLQQDDIDGISCLYGGNCPTSAYPAPTNGCQLDGQAALPSGWMLLAPLCFAALRFGRHTRRRTTARETRPMP